MTEQDTQPPNLPDGDEALRRSLLKRVGVAAENRNIALGRLGERHLDDLDAAALEIFQREVVDTTETECRNLECARLVLGRLLELRPRLVRAVLGHEQERRPLQHDGDGFDVLGLPARIGAGQQRMAVGDVDRHRIAVGGRCHQLGHPGAAGGARHIDDGKRCAEQRFEQLAGEPRQLVCAATRPPRHQIFDGA